MKAISARAAPLLVETKASARGDRVHVETTLHVQGGRQLVETTLNVQVALLLVGLVLPARVAHLPAAAALPARVHHLPVWITCPATGCYAFNSTIFATDDTQNTLIAGQDPTSDKYQGSGSVTITGGCGNGVINIGGNGVINIGLLQNPSTDHEVSMIQPALAIPAVAAAGLLIALPAFALHKWLWRGEAEMESNRAIELM